MIQSTLKGLIGLVLCVVPTCLFAQQLKVGQDYDLHAVRKWDVASLDDGAFGESHNLYTGDTEFFATDVSVPGNNALEVAVKRRLRRESRKENYLLADWELEFPRLVGIFAAGGWQTSMPGAPNQRCSVNRQNFMQATPPIAYGVSVGSQPASFAFASAEYWYGNDLHLPGAGDQRMLVLTAENSSFSHGSHYWITSGNWIFSCLPNTANNKPGEAFLAKSPNGQTFKFDWLVEAAYKPIEKSASNGVYHLTSRLDRKRVMFYPTEVTDENGNWVRYQYDSTNQLTSISSSDGRLIELAYAGGRLSTVTTGGRTWSYNYFTSPDGSGTRLSEVVLPDQSKWVFGLRLSGYEITYGLAPSTCADPPNAHIGNVLQGHMIHPSGLRGDFYFTTRMHGRTFAPRQCTTDGYGTSFILDPDRYPVASMTRKELSGPGIPVYRWDFDYGWSFNFTTLASGYVSNCQVQACPQTRTVTVSKSDGSWEKKTFNSVFGDTEGFLVSTLDGEGSSTLRVVSTSYNTDANQAFPAVYGKDPCHRCHRSHERMIPVRERRTEQQGHYFYWRANSFDAFARPVEVVKYSTPVQ